MKPRVYPIHAHFATRPDLLFFGFGLPDCSPWSSPQWPWPGTSWLAEQWKATSQPKTSSQSPWRYLFVWKRGRDEGIQQAVTIRNGVHNLHVIFSGLVYYKAKRASSQYILAFKARPDLESTRGTGSQFFDVSLADTSRPIEGRKGAAILFPLAQKSTQALEMSMLKWEYWISLAWCLAVAWLASFWS